ncbi:MAG: 3-deoxy-8-phosphooctulonate synthase, partial [Holosporales bacterium]|nr:3-deoxy-8-phosphooctulonate synthase [Holosporales bacterium]
MKHKHVTIGSFQVGSDLPLTLIAGPCTLESRDHVLMMAERLATLTQKLRLPFI